jgi:hypothetical protein
MPDTGRIVHVSVYQNRWFLSHAESLVIPNGEKSDTLIRRISFLFKEKEYHELILKYLVKYRNKSVHAGDTSLDGKYHCYRLQFYFDRLVHTYLSEKFQFNDLGEANEFLDLAPSIKDLNRKKILIEKALGFVKRP